MCTFLLHRTSFRQQHLPCSNTPHLRTTILSFIVFVELFLPLSFESSSNHLHLRIIQVSAGIYCDSSLDCYLPSFCVRFVFFCGGPTFLLFHVNPYRLCSSCSLPILHPTRCCTNRPWTISTSVLFRKRRSPLCHILWLLSSFLLFSRRFLLWCPFFFLTARKSLSCLFVFFSSCSPPYTLPLFSSLLQNSVYWLYSLS